MGDNSLLRSAIVNNLARGIASQQRGGAGAGAPPPSLLRSKRARLNVLAMPRGAQNSLSSMLAGPGMMGPAGPGLR
jgi:hypothetical protein